jgi:hypothetical protein
LKKTSEQVREREWKMRRLGDSEGSLTVPPSIYALEGVLHTREEERNGQHDMAAQKKTTQHNTRQDNTGIKIITPNSYIA